MPTGLNTTHFSTIFSSAGPGNLEGQGNCLEGQRDWPCLYGNEMLPGVYCLLFIKHISGI